jgi:hypothetical protein
MKQITLESQKYAATGSCAGRLLLVWGLFGYAMAVLSRLAGPSRADQLALWVLGALAGLLIAAREI